MILAAHDFLTEHRGEPGLGLLKAMSLADCSVPGNNMINDKCKMHVSAGFFQCFLEHQVLHPVSEVLQTRAHLAKYLMPHKADLLQTRMTYCKCGAIDIQSPCHLHALSSMRFAHCMIRMPWKLPKFQIRSWLSGQLPIALCRRLCLGHAHRRCATEDGVESAHLCLPQQATGATAKDG